MALTEYQIKILRLLADRRKREGVSYIAGGTALNLLLGSPRKSHDIDIFHDTSEALAQSWEKDQKELLCTGYAVSVVREYPSFIEAYVQLGGESILMQWCRDSAFRYFPLVEDPILGLTLHPFDLATNKILAMSGRLEIRDWVDALECNRSVQQLGFLVWAATGKDPGVNPQMLLEDASRLHYSQTEVDLLDFEGKSPDAATLSREWKDAVALGKQVVNLLPEECIGKCVLDYSGAIYKGDFHKLSRDIQLKRLRFHDGSIGGAWPQIVNN